jgi:hypothetical protein
MLFNQQTEQKPTVQTAGFFLCTDKKSALSDSQTGR